MNESAKSTGLRTIIVSRPGVMRQALRAALAAHPWINIIASTGDGLTALNSVASHQPELLIIDSNLLPEEVEALVMAVKAKLPATHCLILLQSTQQKARLLASEANTIVLRDDSARQFQTALRRLRPKTAA